MFFCDRVDLGDMSNLGEYLDLHVPDPLRKAMIPAIRFSPDPLRKTVIPAIRFFSHLTYYSGRSVRTGLARFSDGRRVCEA